MMSAIPISSRGLKVMKWRIGCKVSAPELMDLGSEPPQILEMYGIKNPNQPSFARNCLLARRLIERGVRFVQLFHEVWDQHAGLTQGVKNNAADTDRASARSSRIYGSGACSTKHWSFGVASSVARLWFKAAMTGEITITAPSPFGWQAEASPWIHAR